MSFELTILGCGSATPTLSRNPTAQHIRIGSSEFLIDCGEGAQLQMLKLRLKINKLKAIFISHLHGDHFFGLPGLLSTMHLMGRRNKLTLFGPPALAGILEQIFAASETELKYPLEFIPTNPDQKELLVDTSTFTIHSFPLNHRIPCTGFLFKEKQRLRNIRRDVIAQLQVPIGQMKAIKAGADYVKENGQIIPNSDLTFPPSPSVSYAFCSDTAPDIRLASFIQGVDWLYHEATFLNELENRAIDTFHSTTIQAANTANQVEAKHLIIGHYSSRYGQIEDLRLEVEALFPNVYTAEDGKIFPIV
jgi:ribonuclease Z